MALSGCATDYHSHPVIVSETVQSSILVQRYNLLIWAWETVSEASHLVSPDWMRVGAGYQKMSFLCTAERTTHVTDKTLGISDVCLSAELFISYFMGKNLNTTYSTFKLGSWHVCSTLCLIPQHWAARRCACMLIDFTFSCIGWRQLFKKSNNRRWLIW